jgi:hypothetical protein
VPRSLQGQRRSSTRGVVECRVRKGGGGHVVGAGRG